MLEKFGVLVRNLYLAQGKKANEKRLLSKCGIIERRMIISRRRKTPDSHICPASRFAWRRDARDRGGDTGGVGVF